VPKEIRIVLSELEYELLKAVKGGRTWKQVLLDAARIVERKKLP